MQKFALLACVALLSATAYARELHWDSIDVDARLDRDGRLHVVERQTMVFTGDWNGGERIFNIRFGQKLDFEKMYRIDASGQKITMDSGSTEKIDDYDFVESNTLRWRSRLPSDPEFEKAPLTYELHYTLDYVLVPQGGNRYTLDHDFAFSDREGPILGFTLQLAIDPVWKITAGESPLHYEARNLESGRGYVVTLPLEYTATGHPASVRSGTPAPIRYSGIAAIALGLLSVLAVFLGGEKKKGRFERPAENVDAGWLEKHLFFAPPEVVGALWDRATGASEVAAILAKLTQEKKISTKVTPGGWFRSPEMEMTWTGKRDELQRHERDLVDALFVDGDTTSTKKIRDHYKSSGFNPADKIRGPLEGLIDKKPEWRDQKRRKLWPVLLIAMLVSYALLPFAGLRGGYDFVGALAVGASGIFIAIFGAILAATARHTLTRIPRYVFGFTLPSLIQAGVALAFIAKEELLIGPFSIFAYCAVVIATYAFTISFARNADSPARLAVRHRLILARDYFRRELASGAPQLRDAWMPYIIAFGLGASVDAWVKRFGVAAASSGWSPSTSHSGSLGSSSSGSSGGYGFSGGGGAFGGAGATGSWAIAAGAIASGVAAPSSSGSGGGGGGGGSSGGGGGGGW